MERHFHGEDIAFTQAFGALKNYVNGAVEEQLRALKAENALNSSKRRKGLLTTEEACVHIGKSIRVLKAMIKLGLVDVYIRKGSAKEHYFLPDNLDYALAEYHNRKGKKARSDGNGQYKGG